MSRSLTDLDPDVAEKASRLLLAAQAAGISLGITQTYRTFAEQEGLYSQGRSEPGLVVTWSPPGWSWHNWRRAFDVDILTYPGDKTVKDVYDGPWDTVGALGERCGLTWGGHFKHPDRPHFEDTGGLTLNELLEAHPNGLTASDNKA